MRGGIGHASNLTPISVEEVRGRGRVRVRVQLGLGLRLGFAGIVQVALLSGENPQAGVGCGHLRYD